MQNRRQFLCAAIEAATGVGVTLVLTPLVVACGSTSTTPTSSINPKNATCNGVESTSTLVLGHTHTVCLAMADITVPPLSGQIYTTSGASTDGHVHQFTLAHDALRTVGAGQTIVVTTTVVESHTHDFSL